MDGGESALSHGLGQCFVVSAVLIGVARAELRESIVGALAGVRHSGRASFRTPVTLVGDALGPVAMAGGWYLLSERSRVYVQGWSGVASGPTGRRIRG